MDAPEKKGWFRTASEEEFAAFETEPPQKLTPEGAPKKIWKAGEARESRFAFSSRQLYIGIGATIIALKTALYASGVAISGLMLGGILLAGFASEKPLAKGLTAWSGRGLAGAAVGAKVYALESASVLLGMGSVALSLASLSKQMALKGVAKSAKKWGGKGVRGVLGRMGLFEASQETVGPWAQKAMAFTEGLSRRGKMLAEQEHLGQLSEIGAWRLARQMMEQNKPVAAAKIWLAKPFNPSWEARLPRSFASKSKALLGPSMPFADALDKLAKSHPEQAGFLRDAAASMRAMAERLEMNRELAPAGAAMEQAASTAEPAKPKRARL